MSNIRGVQDRRFKFVQLLNCMFEDQKLSLKAKGFIGYCLTKPKDWKFHINHLCNVLKEGEKALYTIINECIDHGYAYRYQPRSENGDFLPIEIIVSDSKEEISQSKKEIESLPDFKKCLPHRPFGDAIESGAVNDSLTNTNSSNTDGKQQQAAVGSSKKIDEERSLPYPCLDILPLDFEGKMIVTKGIPASKIEKAMEVLLAYKTPPRNIIAVLLWAAKNNIEPSPSAVNIEKENKKHAKKISKDIKNTKNCKLEFLSKCVEFVFPTSQKSAVELSYSDIGFKQKLENYLKEFGFQLC